MRKLLVLLLFAVLGVAIFLAAPPTVKAQTCFTLTSTKNNNHGNLMRRWAPDCDDSTYTSGTNVSVRAVPNFGFTCLGWAQCDGTQSTGPTPSGGTICICDLVMDADKTASATFN